MPDTMTDQAGLTFSHALPITAGSGGLFISRGLGRHPRRLPADYELIFVVRGVLEMQAGRKPLTVSAGETLLLRPLEEHWGTADYGPDLSFFWVHFTRHSPLSETDGGGMTTTVPQQTAVERPDYLAELYRRFLDDQQARRFDPLSRNLLVWLMLSEAHPPHTARPEAAPRVLASLADSYIQSQFYRPITAALIAEHLGCNAQYLSRVYRKAYGQTLTEAIHRRRIGQASHLLLESEMRVNEIARSCGIDDVSYFLQLFKRHKGMTALAFRRLHARIYVNTE